MVKIIDTDFTDLEVEVMHLLAECLNMATPEDELDNGNVCLLIPADLTRVTGGPKVARGVISSLVQKGFMHVSENSDPERLSKMRAEYWAEDKLIPYLFALPPADADFAEQSAQEQEYRCAMQAKGIPAHMHDGVIRFVMQGRAPDTRSFLYAVLSNNLLMAFAKADEANIAALQGWMRLLYNDLPHDCYGSPERVHEWAKSGGLAGMSRRMREVA
jgi:hypothetical protein